MGRGDIASLIAFCKIATAMRHRLIQLLPINETGPEEASPYSALSAFAIDPLYISIGLLEAPSAHGKLGPDARAAGRIAIDRLRAIKLRMLERAYEDFERDGAAAERAEFSAFIEAQRGWLEEYALFRALKDKFRWADWEHWPPALRDRDEATLQAVRTELARSICMYSYWQFLAWRQWSAMRQHLAAHGVGLAGDLAFSPGRDSADVWANRDIFSLERLVGAPPDAFSAQGQRWGLPMPRWERMRAQDYRWWRMRARRSLSLYDLLRIDHAVGFYRTYSFGPDSNEPGRFFPSEEDAQLEQGESFLRMLIEEAGTLALIAEDLGSIPPWVRQSLARLRIRGLKVARWEKKNWGTPDECFIPPGDYPELSVAVTGTHDTETFAQWWSETPENERRRLAEALGAGASVDSTRSRLATPELNALLEGVYRAASSLVITPIQDLFGWSARVNMPGTVGAANWNYRLPLAVERMNADLAIAPQVRAIGEIVKRTCREG